MGAEERETEREREREWREREWRERKKRELKKMKHNQFGTEDIHARYLCNYYSVKVF